MKPRPKLFTELLKDDDRVALGIARQLKPKRERIVFELPPDFSEYGEL